MEIQIPQTNKKRVIIVGGGFAGLAVANKLNSKYFQVVLIDRCNFHQFQPLLYQVASSGLEFGSISFSFRKLLSHKKDFYFRLTEVLSIDLANRNIMTTIGSLSYDYLIIATGTTTNFFGNQVIMDNALPMKNIEEAMELKNTILLNLERALDITDPQEKQALMNVVIVGGGATGVEIAGALSEMRRYIIRKDYPDLNTTNLNIFLLDGTSRVLNVFSEESSANALKSLKKMGVNVMLNSLVVDYKNGQVILKDGSTIATRTLIWVSGVTSERLEGIPENVIGHANRLLVNEYNQLHDNQYIFVIGDIALQSEAKFPKGHPQVAPVAIQQGKLLAANLNRIHNGKPMKPFHYKDQGSLATIGRNSAVADLNHIKLHGFLAWIVWMGVHLRSILGVRNKVIVLIEWVWNYLTYDQTNRFILFIKPRKRNM